MPDIELLHHSQREDILNHYRSLDANSRFYRFGYMQQDEHLTRFVDGLDLEKDLHFVYRDEQGNVVALAQLSRINDDIYEFGISVHQDHKRKGLASMLWKAVTQKAQELNVKEIYVQHVGSNDAMQRFCQSNHIPMHWENSDKIGYFTVQPLIT